jgi:hypothetical protein
VWAFELQTRDGKLETRLAAVNVAAGEGDLDLLSEAEISERLRGIDFQFSRASDFTAASDELTGFRLSDALLYTLAGVLVIEQLFAVSASYHPAQRRSVA